ncbi:MAG: succinate dehydrogenase [Pseudomonadota bacterium]|nr:succinate dehydrogenase [Pseudomonadota bacterium]
MRARGHAGWWAFALHRASGLALTVFLPAHFFALSRALSGEAALDGFLRWTDQPLVRASEIVLVFLLAVHLAGGARLLLAEFHGWRAAWQPGLIAGSIAIATLCALLFALNLGPHP